VTDVRGRGPTIRAVLRAIKTSRSLVIVVAATACSSLPIETPVETVETTVTSDATTTTTFDQPEGCISAPGGASTIDTGDVATDALSLSGQNLWCAEDVVVVAADDLPRVLVAAQLAAALDAPLFLPHPQLAAELGRLGPDDVHLVGTFEVTTPSRAKVHRYDIAQAVETIGELLQTDHFVDVESESSAAVETILAMADGDRIVTAPTTQSSDISGSAAKLIQGLARSTGGTPVWLVDAEDPLSAVVFAATAHAVGASVVAIDAGDLFRHPEVGEAIDGYPDRKINAVGISTDLDDWKLRTLAGGKQLPGGGFELFPDHIHRRFVAFYGNPASPTLGAMGQVTPQGALTMMQEGGVLEGYPETGCFPSPCRGMVPPGLLEGYAQDGAHVVPTFNYIASVAAPGCGSTLFPAEHFQEAIDLAAEVGGYVMFDLQPGSEDFLSHAQFYEEALRLPHVGLAIDPEWRCGWPGQTEFDRIGTVTAAEINQVIEWVADLVNREGLPQKLILIQQFTDGMIQDRDQLVERPEVQVVIQMDGEGQGSLGGKEGSWRQVTAGTEDNHWRWGWKNFFVRDHADGPYSPEQTIDRQPVPVYVSYQ
jgi:hypothetical protein